jgi:acetylornithine deacetylase
VKDGKIYGRGSCDMKAGLAAYLEVVRHLQRTGTPLSGDLIIAGVIDEEHAMAGSRHFGLHGPKVDYAIVAEPTLLQISTAHKGQMLTTIRTKGLAAHSSMPDKGRNAIYHMGAVLGALQEYADDVSARAPDAICGSPSFSVGVIRGGDNACSVPDFCEIDVDRRTIPGETSAGVMKELHNAMESAKPKAPELDFEIGTPFLDLPPLNTRLDALVTKSVVAACRAVIGQVDVSAFPGSTDAPNFGCPTVICGPGALAQCHSLNEYVAINQIEDAVRIYIYAILAMQTET